MATRADDLANDAISTFPHSPSQQANQLDAISIAAEDILALVAACQHLAGLTEFAGERHEQG